MKKAVGVVLLLVPLCTMSGPLGVSQLRSMAKAVAFPESSAEEDEVLEYLRAQQADSPLLLWGAEARINFLSGRRSPTRYSYMYPLTFRRYQQRTRFAELLLDLAARPDTVIIDTLGDSPNCVGTARSVVPAKGVDRGFAWRPIPEELMLPLRKHIARHYERDRTFSNGWIAYLPRG